ncbi:FAD-dependent oxidoreductase [Nannocystis pusilla]|uniref:FAD-dependent oxidoreductase n=1 Tax=Nannocystis pusilla TaxID=889268 RepID=UPI003B834EFF
MLSQPGSIALRLGQAESGVKGLLLCGDWTRTDLNCGCVEAATTSGMLAARAISNEPRTVWRPGF